MKRSFYFLLYFTSCISFGGCTLTHLSTVTNASTQNKSSIEKQKIEALIDRLQEEGKEGIGTHSLAWADGFMALDEEPQFRGGVIGTPKPVVSAIMRELVRYGVSAIPYLLNHLSDDRPSKLTLEERQFPSIRWFGDDYHSRFPNPGKQPTGVNSKENYNDRRVVKEYIFRVGDLCFVVLGQIVNRNLTATRYQPSCCLVINSPVQTPALVLAARQDWAELTKEDHEKQLMQDALSKYPYATESAIKRLLYYYPQEGETLALRLLQRPLYDGGVLWQFIEEQLVEKDDLMQWKKLIEEFRRKSGDPSADALPFRLHWIYFLTSFVQDEKFLRGKERATKILAQLYPLYDPLTPHFINAAEVREQIDLINGLASFRSEKLDAAIANVFRNALKLVPESENDIYEMDQLALSCLNRFGGKKYKQVFSSYVKKRIQDLSSEHGSQATSNRKQKFLLWQKKMNQ